MMLRALKKLLLTAMIVSATVFAITAEAKFCWRDSYGRGVGTIPTDCGAKQNDAGLCYPACAAGYGAAGPVCWGKCPAGFTDHGVGCTKPAPYGRGAGYPWKFGDKAFSLDGARNRCNKDNPTAGCEKDGAILYPKCKPGFHKVGCCVCSPDCPSGFGDTGATCTKPTQTRGAGTIPTACSGGKQNDAGLCYTGCNTDYKGVGPVCWGKCPPSSPVDCGAGCAATSSECVQAITDQVVSVMDVAVNIATTVATAGTGTAAKAAATTAAKATAKNVVVKGAGKAAIKAELKRMAKESGQSIGENTLDQMAQMGAGEDFDPYALDPTGIATVVKAYNKPICGKS